MFLFLCFFLGMVGTGCAATGSKKPSSGPSVSEERGGTPADSRVDYREEIEKIKPEMEVSSHDVVQPEAKSPATKDALQQSGEEQTNSVPSVLDYTKGFIPDLIGGTKKIFTRDNLPLALIGGGLVALSLSVDHTDGQVKDYFLRERPLDGIDTYGNEIGEGQYHIGLGAALFAAGQLAGNKKLADTGIATLEALLINGIVTQALKYGTHRLRPNGRTYMSFPSGHASSTAALAASISSMYDWHPAIAVPLFSAAGFVAASRIQSNMHYLSDVLGGLTIGTIIGMSVAAHHKEKDWKPRFLKNVSFSPVIEKDFQGGLFTYTW